MAMQLTMPLSSSADCRFFYPSNHVIAVRLSLRAAPISVTTARRQQPVFSISSKLSSRDWEVLKSMDCLPNPKTPWLKLPSVIDPVTGLVVDSFYSPVENREVRLNRRDCLGVPETAKCFASTGEWLAFVDPQDDCPLYLTNPFFNDHDMSVISLPSLATIPSCSGVQRDPLTGRVIRFGMFGSANAVADELNIDSTHLVGPDHVARKIQNLTISHLDPCHTDCVAVALHGESPTLAYSRIWDDRESSLGWIGLQEDSDPLCLNNQVVFSHAYKMFYTISYKGIEVFDLFNDRKKRSKRVILFSFDDIIYSLKIEFGKESDAELKDLRNLSWFLAEEKTATGKYRYQMIFHLLVLNDNGKSSDLLLIVRHCCIRGATAKTLHFDVFRVDFLSRRLKRMKTLEEGCVFVSANQSFSLCATKFPGLHPNSIYFIGKKLMDHGIFNMENNKIEPLTSPYSPMFPYVSSGRENLSWISPSNVKN